MSTNTQKIEKALRELGLFATSIVWEPWGQAMEMQGIEGGWRVEVVDPMEDCEYDFMGLSTEELLEEIYQHSYSQAIGFWGECEYPGSGLCFVNDYGFGQHICAKGAH